MVRFRIVLSDRCKVGQSTYKVLLWHFNGLVLGIVSRTLTFAKEREKAEIKTLITDSFACELRKSVSWQSKGQNPESLSLVCPNTFIHSHTL